MICICKYKPLARVAYTEKWKRVYTLYLSTRRVKYSLPGLSSMVPHVAPLPCESCFLYPFGISPTNILESPPYFLPAPLHVWQCGIYATIPIVGRGRARGHALSLRALSPVHPTLLGGQSCRYASTRGVLSATDHVCLGQGKSIQQERTNRASVLVGHMRVRWRLLRSAWVPSKRLLVRAPPTVANMNTHQRQSVGGQQTVGNNTYMLQ